MPIDLKAVICCVPIHFWNSPCESIVVVVAHAIHYLVFLTDSIFFDVASKIICSALWNTFPEGHIGEASSNFNLPIVIIVVGFQVLIIWVIIELAMVYFLLCDQLFSFGISLPIKIYVMNVICKFTSGKQALHALPFCIVNELFIWQWLTSNKRRDLVKVCIIVNCVITHNPSVVFYRLFPSFPGFTFGKRIFYVSLSVLDSGRFSCNKCYEP